MDSSEEENDSHLWTLLESLLSVGAPALACAEGVTLSPAMPITSSPSQASCGYVLVCRATASDAPCGSHHGYCAVASASVRGRDSFLRVVSFGCLEPAGVCRE